MVRELELNLTVAQAQHPETFTAIVAQQTGIQQSEIWGLNILKRSVDARKRPVSYYFKFRLYINEKLPVKAAIKYLPVQPDKTVHIIGCGPAGLFAALECLKAGVKPIIFERGKPINERKKDIALLYRERCINPESNYCFGEGGAGTFSDGKLYTRSTKRGDVQDVLATFVAHGAPESILYDAHPHIGSDALPRIIAAMRQTILGHGGEVHFNCKLTGLQISDGQLKGIVINDHEEVPVKHLLLATGHSARDIYGLLHKNNIQLEAKPFAMGVRVEHPQELINAIQYHGQSYDRNLPAATYKLVEQVNNRGVFSFCMCPGGIVVPASTEQGGLVVNGMSNAKRNSPYADAGIVVQVFPEDISREKLVNPFSLLAFQDKFEKACYVKSGKPLAAPAQRMTDFVKGKLSGTLPVNSYIPGTQPVVMDTVLPPFISDTLKKAFVLFDKKMKGYYTEEAILLATESRTSSPVRIPRNKDTYEHITLAGLYPCGEGAGYAGGITSSAMDGVNCVKAILRKM